MLKGKVVAVAFVKMVVTAVVVAMMMVWMVDIAFGQEPNESDGSVESIGSVGSIESEESGASITKNLRLRPGFLVPVVEWGNLGDPDDWSFTLNGGQLAVGAEVGWWEEGVTEEKDRKALDWDIGAYTFLMAENGELFYVALGLLLKTLKYKGKDLFAFGVKVRLTKDEEIKGNDFVDRLAVVWAFGF